MHTYLPLCHSWLQLTIYYFRSSRSPFFFFLPPYLCIMFICFIIILFAVFCVISIRLRPFSLTEPTIYAILNLAKSWKTPTMSFILRCHNDLSLDLKLRFNRAVFIRKLPWCCRKTDACYLKTLSVANGDETATYWITNPCAPRQSFTSFRGRIRCITKRDVDDNGEENWRIKRIIKRDRRNFRNE